MKKNKGFTLLISIIVTSIMLLVSFVVTNIALKQIVLADAGVESQYAFYNADSGADCAIYWDLVNSGSSAFATSTTGTITCGSNSNITTGNQTIQTVPTQLSLIGGGGSSNPTSIFQLDYTKGCAIVSVTKFDNGNTTVSSKGYNTCDVDAIKRYERGITITYVGNNNTIFGESGNASSIGHIQLSTGSMSFSANTGATPASQNLTIQNTGTNALNWSASTNQSWCHISSLGGTIGSGSQTIVAISVDSQASPGTYDCVITISSVDSDNSPQAVAVSDTVSSSFPCATGGTVTTSGNYKIHTFTASDTFTVTCSGAFDYLVVGGGGAGGAGSSSAAGGGGGGQVLSGTVSIGTGNFSIVVGAGGVGVNNGSFGAGGENSSFNGVIAAGGSGGGAGGFSVDVGTNNNGRSGTIGGGGGGDGSRGTGTSFNGGNPGSNGGGGGGGAGGNGQSGPGFNTGGAGGIGVLSSITGSSVGYGGGGGGGGSITGGAAVVGYGGGDGCSGTCAGTSATANTGGGGGGARFSGKGGNGGSGIVIIKYQFQ